MRKRVYIAGPISKGDLLHNVNQATAAFVALVKAGFAPFCPHWSVYSKKARHELIRQPTRDNGDVAYVRELICTATTAGNDEMTHADWMEIDLPWVVMSDALLRLPGESTGADREVACAVDNDIPVFHDLNELIAWAA